MEAAFWGCLVFIGYAYAGYPLALYLLARLIGRPVSRAPFTPSVSFIITARNEAARIRAKVENTLALDYPRDRLEILVASDHSDDGTDAIVSGFSDRGVRLLRAPERKGKEAAQALAIAATSGEVLVFSDAATRLDPGGVASIVQNFADPTIGCASSVDRVLAADGTPTGEGAYVRYEMLLRALESKVGSVVGLSGSFFAARRQVCSPWPTDLPSDFNTLLNTLRLGMRGVSDPAAVGSYVDLSDPKGEYARKVRTVSRGLRSLARNLHLLNPVRYGLAAWQLFSHKLCRWMVPFAMIGALFTSGLLAPESGVYAVAFGLQCFAYVAAGWGLLAGKRFAGPARIVGFFVLVNISILHAWFNTIRGRKAVTWEPTRRQS
jgi:glycosyltransferase involved in cell wall biosynthesis